MTSPLFGRAEAREVIAERQRRRVLIRQAIIAVVGGLIFLGAAALAIGTGFSVLLALCSIASFVMVGTLASEL